MAKTSLIQREEKREATVAKYAKKRAELSEIINDSKRSDEERYIARLELQKLPRNSAPTRIHNRCELSGRSKGFYRKLKLSRIALRDLSNFGQVPGMTKASW